MTELESSRKYNQKPMNYLSINGQRNNIKRYFDTKQKPRPHNNVD